MEKYILKKENHTKLIEKLAGEKQTYGPVAQGERVNFKRIKSANEMTLDMVITDMSAKSFVFPRVEKLFSYTVDKNDITTQNIDLDAMPYKVVFGVRPCDASGLASLSAIFEWDPEDPIYARRKERTTIITYACTKSDSSCFCTSVGGSPGNTKGSDMMLTEVDGSYLVEVLSAKGEEIVASAPGLFEPADDIIKEKYIADVPVRFDIEQLKKNVDKSFETTIYEEYAIRCIGCGACAYVCPACACFDIQDEKKGSKGERTRSWDSCGLTLFTLHTSGHNPRDNQGARWRQRVMHKFSYMPERLDVLGCVGCGRCTRKCPVDMNIADNLKHIAEMPI